MITEYTLDKADEGYDVRWSGNFERTIGEIRPTEQGNRHEAFNNNGSIGTYSSRDGAMCAVIAAFECTD